MSIALHDFKASKIEIEIAISIRKWIVEQKNHESYIPIFQYILYIPISDA